MLITKTDLGYAISDKSKAGVDAKVLVYVKENSSGTVVNTLKMPWPRISGKQVKRASCMTSI